MAYNFKLGKIYRFSTHAPAKLGATHTSMEVMAILRYSQAIKIDAQLGTIHAAVLPNLPNGASNPTQLSYVLFKDGQGNEDVYATVWIDESSVVEMVSLTGSYIVPNIGIVDHTKILEAISLLGYSVSNSSLS